MQKSQLKEAFIETLERERSLRGWTQIEMAERLEMSVPGYRKMVSGMTETISLYTAYLASIVLNIPISLLFGSTEQKELMLKKIYNAPVSTCKRIEYYLDYDAKFRDVQNKYSDRRYTIDVITLTGYLEDGMILDSSTIDRVDIANNFGDKVTKGFRITENSLLPVYSKDDIVLIEEKMPRSGDTTVVLNMNTRLLYIRKLIIGQMYELHPIHGRGSIIYIDPKERADWFAYGRVVTSIRNDCKENGLLVDRQ